MAARCLIFMGEGKGKTTAALGMLLRAVGHGQRATLIQFLKNDATTGELQPLRQLGVEVFQGGEGFVPPPDSPKFAAHRQAAVATLAHAKQAIESDLYAMIVLDELCGAVAKGLLAEAAVLAVLERAPTGCVLAITGRDATPGLIDQADTVSEILSRKHGYESGLAAQKGVEF